MLHTQYNINKTYCIQCTSYLSTNQNVSVKIAIETKAFFSIEIDIKMSDEEKYCTFSQLYQ